MRAPRDLLTIAMACTIACWSTPVAACSLPRPPAFDIVPNPADETPPGMPEVHADVRIGSDRGCSGSGDCQDLTYVDFYVRAVDDVSPSGDIGYLFEAVDADLLVRREPVAVDEDGHILIYLNGRSEAMGPDFDVRVSAVDGAGNVSTESTVVTIRRSEAGCQMASNTYVGGIWAAAAMFALLARRRRQRS